MQQFSHITFNYERLLRPLHQSIRQLASQSFNLHTVYTRAHTQRHAHAHTQLLMHVDEASKLKVTYTSRVVFAMRAAHAGHMQIICLLDCRHTNKPMYT